MEPTPSTTPPTNQAPGQPMIMPPQAVNPAAGAPATEPMAGRQAAAAGLPAINSVSQLNRPWAAIYSMTAVFITLVAILITYFLNVQSTSKVESYNRDIDTINQQLAEPSVSAIEKDIQDYAASIKSYETAVTKQLDYSKLMGELAGKLPKDVIFDSVVYDEKNNVRLSGVAGSFVSVAKAYLSLKDSAYLADVALINVSINDKDSARRITYTVTAEVQTSTLQQRDEVINSPERTNEEGQTP